MGQLRRGAGTMFNFEVGGGGRIPAVDLDQVWRRGISQGNIPVRN